ncbi:sugar phosphate isomerase/epimerase family protein [Haloarcula nitratireducens]|uniref:Sugar phosphate isomerase/epimerase n=1 Tax=Haloarcula nitratireducens TaxID=2487749 RepID=A0AAW4PDW5_9EURY|nr:sugar phosphate isomerase/epimerase family protein [Halomicroarcula nitratireducens]MBX0296131.1 sugar phosphate isomerase/epimerase [Halomicroarcula nitratireducens]
MQFAFSANAFHEYSPVETVEILADIGYDGVEPLLGGTHLHPADTSAEDVAAVTEALEETGLEISNCNAFMISETDFQHPSYIEPDADYRRERIEYTREAVELADTFDADSISIQPGGPIPDGQSRAWGMETFAESMREIVPVAEQRGVNILVEPEPDLLIETTEHYLDFANRLDSGAVGCNFDAGHLFCVGENPAEAVGRLSDHTPHYHLEDIPADRTHEHTQLGDGAMDIDGFLQTVEDSGYDGFVTVELYPYQETAAETAREAYAYLDERGWI